MVGSFSYSRLKVQPWSPPAAQRAPRAADPGPAPVPAEEPLAWLLNDLRGREITLTVDGRLITGKLIQSDPILLVNGKGEVTAVAPGRTSLITF